MFIYCIGYSRKDVEQKGNEKLSKFILSTPAIRQTKHTNYNLKVL